MLMGRRIFIALAEVDGRVRDGVGCDVDCARASCVGVAFGGGDDSIGSRRTCRGTLKIEVGVDGIPAVEVLEMTFA